MTIKLRILVLIHASMLRILEQNTNEYKNIYEERLVYAVKQDSIFSILELKC
jgi:hypothetical protein